MSGESAAMAMASLLEAMVSDKSTQRRAEWTSAGARWKVWMREEGEQGRRAKGICK